ncbi:MAG: zf-HC2 domain-containing protein [Bacteroidota bacterium]
MKPWIQKSRLMNRLMITSCEEIEEFLYAYVEDELDPGTRRRFDMHLRMCPQCKTYLQQYRRTVSICADLPAPEAPKELADTTMEFLRRQGVC